MTPVIKIKIIIIIIIIIIKDFYRASILLLEGALQYQRNLEN